MSVLELIEKEWGNFESVKLDFGFRNFVNVKHPKGSEGKFCEDGIQFQKGLDGNNYLKGRKIENHFLIKNGQIFWLDDNELFIQLFYPEPCNAVVFIPLHLLNK